ncbi:MAG: hypothetical protein ACJ0A3_03460 [Dehalococcoidia bacterium]
MAKRKTTRQVLKDYSPTVKIQPQIQPLEKMFPEYPVGAGMFHIPASSGRNPTES